MFKYVSNAIFLIPAFITIIFVIKGQYKKQVILQQLNAASRKHISRMKSAMMVMGIILIGVSIMGPQTLKDSIDVEQRSLDIYVLLDVSKSMLAEDVVPNRLVREKEIVTKLIDNLEGDRVGFIPFASAAYIQMPLTNDYNLANMFLDVIDTDMIGGGGSNVGKAIKLAAESFDRTSVGDRVIVVISDGEENDNDSVGALKGINDDNLKVYTIGVGTREGGLIPVYSRDGSEIIDYKKDKSGSPVISKLDGDILKALASIGNGHYYTSGINGDEVVSLIEALKALEKSDKKVKTLKRYNHLYQWFLAPGLLLFLLGYLNFSQMALPKGKPRKEVANS